MDLIQFRRDTLANWTTVNPILAEGEVGFVTDEPNKFKIGDGANPWSLLPWRGWTGTIAQTTGDDPNAVMSQKAITDELADVVRLGISYENYEYPEGVAATSATKALKDWDNHDIRSTYMNYSSAFAALGAIDLTGNTSYNLREIHTSENKIYRCKKKFTAGNTFVLAEFFDEIDAYEAFIMGTHVLS